MGGGVWEVECGRWSVGGIKGRLIGKVENVRVTLKRDSE